MKSVAQTIIKAESFYTIAAKNGNVIQAVEGAKDGSDIRLGKYDHKPEQEWSFVREGDGVYRIKNRANGKMIDLMMTGTANGTWLHLWEDVNGTSQMWTVRPTPDGSVRLVSSWAGGKCVDTVGFGAEVNTILQIWQEAASDEQLWIITEVKTRAKRAPKADKKAAEPALAAETATPAEVKAEAPAEEKPKAKRAPRKKAAEAEGTAAAEVKTEAPAEEAAPAAKPRRKCATRKKAAAGESAAAAETKTEAPAEDTASAEKPKTKRTPRKKSVKAE